MWGETAGVHANTFRKHTPLGKEKAEFSRFILGSFLLPVTFWAKDQVCGFPLCLKQTNKPRFEMEEAGDSATRGQERQTGRFC